MPESTLIGHETTKDAPVSVLIPVFNTPAEQLSLCLQSICAQTHEADEIVIVDDASTDPETIDFLKQLSVYNLKVVYLESNHGIAGALNRGLAEVRNELVARMDSDDIMLPTRLEVQLQYMTNNPSVDVLSGALFYCTESGGIVSFDPTPVTHPAVITKEIAKTSRWFINHPATMYRRSKVLSAGGYDSKLRGFPEDYDLWVRMINAGCVLHNLSEPLIYLRLSNGSLTQNFNSGLDVFFSTRQASIAVTELTPMQATAFPEPIPVSPLELLSPLRFDVVVKYLYAQSLINNYSTQYFRDLYKEHLRVWNGFVEVNNPAKNSFEAFDNDFKNLIMSLQTVGFDSGTSLIPLVDGNCMINGAHRVAAALALNTNVYYRHSFDPMEGQKDCSWETVFRKEGFPDDMASRVALEYSKLKDKTRIVTIFPSASHDLEYSLNILRKYGRLFYYKSISLSENGPFNLMQQLYPYEPWAGNASNAYAGYREKERLCFTKTGPVVAVLVEFDDPSIGIEVKRRIRDHFGMGNHSVHINDHHHETIRLAQTLFNENSIHFLNKSKLSALPVYDRLIARYSGGLDLNGMNPEHFCVTGSAVLSSYGIRDCADLDYLHHGTMIFHDPEDLIHSHNNYGMSLYDIGYDDLIFNPSNHYYCNGLKFASLKVIANLKKRRNEDKDRMDLIAISARIQLPSELSKSPYATISLDGGRGDTNSAGRIYEDFLTSLNLRGRILGVGDSARAHAVLNYQCFRESYTHCTGLNIDQTHCGQFNHFDVIHGNANSMPFADDEFDAITSFSHLEHDKYFWKSLAEFKRVLKPGGKLIICLPGYSVGDVAKETTYCYHIHGIDYYRFSPVAFRDVFFDGYTNVQIYSAMTPVRLIGVGELSA
jgi:glycosyltransferase involved in cell wall biosynthesis/SAM-dependent methyltransferase